VPENPVVRHLPFINTIRRHHTAHHNFGIMMHCRMNLTFPLPDCAMHTLDLKSGLLGQLFNGYCDKYIKDELKPVIARFRTASASHRLLDGRTQPGLRVIRRDIGNFLIGQ